MKLLALSRGLSTLVDDDVYVWASKFKWYAQARQSYSYAVRNCYKNGKHKAKTILLHREIVSAGPDMDVDHINGDPLDNRRENLRACSHEQNMRNQKTRRGKCLRGVCKRGSKEFPWVARAGSGSNRKILGRFKTEIEAHNAYVAASKKLYGEFFRE